MPMRTPMTMNMFLKPLVSPKRRKLMLKSYDSNRMDGDTAPYVFWYSVYLLWWEENPSAAEVKKLFREFPYFM
jgi:hypothetical protein